MKKADSFKKRSLDYLTEALEIVTKSFPCDSPCIQRIQLKSKTLIAMVYIQKKDKVKQEDEYIKNVEEYELF